MIGYDQKTGTITLNDAVLGIGYSGNGGGLNNPDDEAIPDVGPIPRGIWAIVRWDDEHGDKGSCVAVLEPVGQDAHGRTAFLIHGDNAACDYSASHGCIVADRTIRNQLRSSGLTELLVS